MTFEYDKTSPNAEYYEILATLMERWEYEIVEFKEAKGGYNEDKIGKYFSAISNEANLKNQQYGWLILGVSEVGKNKKVVGTSFKRGEAVLMEKFKYEISKDTTDGMTFLDIIELKLINDGKPCRVLMFKIPAAVAGMPTEWKTRYYARNGESLVPLQQYKIDAIRNQERRDWSKQVIAGSSIKYLDKEAIAFAKEKYKEKMNRTHIAEEIDALKDEEFLTKIRLMVDGKVTNAAMILLGKAEYNTVFQSIPSMMWRLIEKDGTIKDYEIFDIPYILVSEKVFTRVRNLTYRYMPNQLSLFPKETQQYDGWLLRELLNNCIAHSNYQLGGRIYINEEDDCISIANPGDFLPQKVENVLQKTYNPPFYRNQLLADSMVKFHMIDTATSGIKKIYRIQKEKYFPMPDYDFSVANQVSVKIYGKIIDAKYTYILFDYPELELETVYLLDQVQKGRGNKLSPDAVKYLRKHKLVEGRINNLYLSAEVSREIQEETQYIKNKAFDDEYYKKLIVSYLETYGFGKKKDFIKLLSDKLPDAMSEPQKVSKVKNLLAALRNEGQIITDSTNKRLANWMLKK